MQTIHLDKARPLAISMLPDLGRTCCAVLLYVLLGSQPVLAQLEVTDPPPAHDFGEVPLGSRYASQYFTVRNRGDSIITLGEVHVEGSGMAVCMAIGCPVIAPDDFLLPLSRCSYSPLFPGQSCSTLVSFVPKAEGKRTAQLVFPVIGGPALTRTLTGVGISQALQDQPPVCTLHASPVVLAIGGTATLSVHCNPAASSYTWSNTGFAATQTSGTVSPAAPSRYSVVGHNSAGSGNAASTAVYVCNTAPIQNYGALVLEASSGNDQIASSMANDTVDGGAGLDTVVYNCNRENFTVSKTSAGWVVSSVAEGLDSLANVERVQFGNATVALDISGNAGQVYRLYQAAFNRVPDNGGLRYWINQMDSGMGLQEVAARFMDSAEFASLYGKNLGHADFLTRLYDHVLHRAPDPGGYAWWLEQLNTGLHTRITALMGFSESPENQAGVMAAIMHGIDLPN